MVAGTGGSHFVARSWSGGILCQAFNIKKDPEGIRTNNEIIFWGPHYCINRYFVLLLEAGFLASTVWNHFVTKCLTCLTAFLVDKRLEAPCHTLLGTTPQLGYWSYWQSHFVQTRQKSRNRTALAGTLVTFSQLGEAQMVLDWFFTMTHKSSNNGLNIYRHFPWMSHL